MLEMERVSKVELELDQSHRGELDRSRRGCRIWNQSLVGVAEDVRKGIRARLES